MVDRARYCFRLTAWNELAGADDSFMLIYYVRNDGSNDIEIQDPKHKKRFLARIAYPQLKVEDVRPGGRIMIYSRQYKVEDYEDKATRDALSRSQTTSVVLLSGRPGAPGSAAAALGRAWAAAEAQGLRVVEARMAGLGAEDAAALGAGASGGVPAGSVLALAVMGEESADKARAVAAHLAAELPAGARATCAADAAADAALRAAFFGAAGAGSGSGGGSGARARLRIARESDAGAGAGSESTCFIVLPTAVANGQAGAILTEAQERLATQGLAVTAARLATFTRSQADEFLEVYKAVVPEHVDMVNELSRGPFVALEVSGAGAVQAVRDLCGPRDIEVAKRVRAASLRARFGASAGASGVHCTDLAQDGVLECEFVFALTS